MSDRRVMRKVVFIWKMARSPSWEAKLECGHIVPSHQFQHIGALRRCRECEAGHRAPQAVDP